MPHRWRNLLPLTGLTIGQVHQIVVLTLQALPPRPGRPGGLAAAGAVLRVLVHLRTNLTTRALAALFHTSQSLVDRIIHHLGPVLARTLRPDPDTNTQTHPWIIDDSLIPVHDQSTTAISKNYRRSVNTQIIICAHRPRVLVAIRCWPGNRNDVIVARGTVAKLLDGNVVLGDGRYRGITSITTPRRDTTDRIIGDDHHRTHRTRARVEHVIARLKDWQILRQRRRRGQVINHSLQVIAGFLEPQDPQPITGQLLVRAAHRYCCRPSMRRPPRARSA